MFRLRGKSFALAIGAVVPYVVILASPKAPTPTVSYGRDIAPLFKARCVSCHSGAAPAGNLNLATKAGILKGGLSGKLFDGSAKTARLMARIDGSKPPQMPMGMPPLSSEEQAKIKTWLQEGMNFDSATPAKHWAYIAPVAAPVPQLGSSWVRNPVDAFILRKLRAEGIHPSPEATRETLIRRVTLDLIGLPPTPLEVQNFVHDKAPGAYERVVDRLLKSPHYGERQARGWLDLARYADSDGYEKDLGRNAWPYRDWVINAFNANMPYDTFTIKQIAGDLLPNSTIQDKVATGFQRNTMQNLEGGVDQKEAHFMVELDRAETTSAVWLGSTLNCARCHDHKYDPFTQKDYYKMVAFYSNTTIYPRGPKAVGEEKWLEATLKIPSPAITADIDSEQNRVKLLTERIEKDTTSNPQAFQTWMSNAQAPVSWEILHPMSVVNAKRQLLRVAPNGAVTETGSVPDTDTYLVELPPCNRPINGIRLEALADPAFPSGGPGRAPNGNFVVTRFEVWDGNRPIPLRSADADFSQPDFQPTNSLIGSPNGWAVNGQTGSSHQMIVDLGETIPTGASVKVVIESDSPYAQHVLGKFRLSETEHLNPSTSLMAASLKALLSKPASIAAADPALNARFEASSPECVADRLELKDAQSKIAADQSKIPTAMVMQEKPTQGLLSEWVRTRGVFASKAERVLAGTPSILPPLPPGRADRLTLAKWLVSRKNPLTARVEVNRTWEQLFGRGLVETSGDFGTRGSPPSHPQLLDWLACWFMNHNWDMKALNRLLVTSSTYRQTSDATPILMEKDPENRLLGRGARFRMEAEMIHDVALSAGGILSNKVGGPSVYPYQPVGVWDSPYSGETWMTSNGEDRYRRGIYTFWKRTAPYPSFVALDATSREICTIRRIRTNTPLQALALLNDKLMVQAASALGKRMEAFSPNLGARLTEGFFICTSRAPIKAELDRLKRLEKTLEARYATRPALAKMLGGTPTDAAYTLVANTLLNLDETITKS